LQENISSCLKITNIHKFNLLENAIEQQYIIPIINKHYPTALLKCQEMINCQLNYIWTDDPEFLDILNVINGNIEEYIRKLLNMYCISISKVLEDVIPKIIMTWFINPVTNDIQFGLLDWLYKLPLEEMVQENPDIKKERDFYKSQINTIKLGIELIHSFTTQNS
jgi:hypothetical protein